MNNDYFITTTLQVIYGIMTNTNAILPYQKHSTAKTMEIRLHKKQHIPKLGTGSVAGAGSIGCT